MALVFSRLCDLLVYALISCMALVFSRLCDWFVYALISCVLSFSHHAYKKVEGGKQIELGEVGPRFEMKRKCLYALNG